MGAHSAEITTLLKAWSGGDPAALERLADQVYPELRLMARRYMKNERLGNTLQATALVHEVYLRLVDVTKVEWRERAQFFAMAAQMMRRILVNAAHARSAQKRGGVTPKVNIDETAVLSPGPDRSILALDEALTAFSRPSTVVRARFRASCWFANPASIAVNTCSPGRSNATPLARCSRAAPGAIPFNPTSPPPSVTRIRCE